jgi:hypothetical protein
MSSHLVHPARGPGCTRWLLHPAQGPAKERHTRSARARQTAARPGLAPASDGEEGVPGGRVPGIVPLGQRAFARGRSGWFAGAEAAEHAGVLEADGAGGGLDGGAVADQVPGSLQP